MTPEELAILKELISALRNQVFPLNNGCLDMGGTICVSCTYNESCTAITDRNAKMIDLEARVNAL